MEKEYTLILKIWYVAKESGSILETNMYHTDQVPHSTLLRPPFLYNPLLTSSS